MLSLEDLPTLSVSVLFNSLLAVDEIMIDGSKKCNCQLGIEIQSLHVIERRNV